MLNKVFNLYALFFAKPYFYKFNKFLYILSLRGLGILNYQTERLSGELYWLRKYLKTIKKPFVVDVGAHVGNYIKNVLNINPNAVIIAIEPHPISFQKLKNTFSMYNNIKLVNYAIGDIESESKLFDYKNNDGSSHATLYKDVIKDLHKSNIVSHKVKTTTLDSLLKEYTNDIDLLKIDTEGNEYKVLLGSRKLLVSNRIKVIQFEFNEMNIISKTTFKDFWDLLNNNFNFYRILPYGNLLPIKNYSPIDCEIYQYQNILCINKKLKLTL